MSYHWTVIQAPMGSIFAPTYVTNTTVANSTLPTNQTQDADFFYTQTGILYTETTKAVSTSVIVANGQIVNTAFVACITPDLAGNYMLALSVDDYTGCQTVTQSVSFTASCGPAPSVTLNVAEHAEFNASAENHYVWRNGTTNGWNVSLSRMMPRRIVLDARGSSSPNSKLQYYWSWRSPDKRADTDEAQDNIETPYSPTSALILQEARWYHLRLTVHDGCQIVTLDFDIEAFCGDAQPAQGVPAATASLDGRNLYSFVLALSNDPAYTCSNAVQWSFVNYSMSGTWEGVPTPSAGSSISVSVFVSFILALLALLL